MTTNTTLDQIAHRAFRGKYSMTIFAFKSNGLDYAVCKDGVWGTYTLYVSSGSRFTGDYRIQILLESEQKCDIFAFVRSLAKVSKLKFY